MNELVAYCGLDCEKCEARLATVNDDDALRAKVAKHWSELNKVEITPEMINCVGCRADGVKTVFCDSLCPIRQCAAEKQIGSCGDCEAMKTCEKLAMITGTSEEARRRLEKKLTVYSSPLCPDCRECKANFDAHGVRYDLIDIGESMKNLKAFLRLRDGSPVFDPCRANGSVGIPAIVRPDGSVTLDWEGVLAEMRLEVVYREGKQFCSIDGKGC